MFLAIVLALQQPSLQLQRNLDDGRTTHYQMSMTEHLESVDADVQAVYDEVAKTTPSGLQLIVTTTTFGISAGGQDVPAPISNPHTLPLNKSGQMVGDGFLNEASVSRMIPDLFAGYVLGVPLTIAKTVQLAPKPDDQSREKVSGTATLESEDGGIAKVSLRIAISYSDTKTPMKVEGTAFFNVSTGEVEHAEGTISDLPPAMTSRYAIQSADFKVKHLKSL